MNTDIGSIVFCFFFFQAEDGIRDYKVTGVQTCALPIWMLSNANGLNGTAAWTQLSPTGTLPAARNEHTAVYDAGSKRMFVFGGATLSANLNDTWVLTNASVIPAGPL